MRTSGSVAGYFPCDVETVHLRLRWQCPGSGTASCCTKQFSDANFIFLIGMCFLRLGVFDGVLLLGEFGLFGCFVRGCCMNGLGSLVVRWPHVSSAKCYSWEILLFHHDAGEDFVQQNSGV